MLVSVCIPTYNGEEFLQEALDSVKNQTYPNIEVIISDDNSKDSTLLICNKFKTEVSFPVHIYHHTPSGIGANWNNCIEKSNGKYIKFIFQDDLLEPTCIEKMVKILQENKNVKLVASKRKLINNSSTVSEEINTWIQNYEDLQKQFNLENNKNYNIIDKSYFKREDFFKSPFNKIGEPSTVMFEKSIVKKIGYFSTELKQILDYEYWYRILTKYDIAIISEKLVSFRIHDKQETNNNRKKPINDYELYEEFQYKKLFRFLSRKRQYQLLKKFNPRLFKIIAYYHQLRY